MLKNKLIENEKKEFKKIFRHDSELEKKIKYLCDKKNINSSELLRAAVMESYDRMIKEEELVNKDLLETSEIKNILGIY